MSKAFHAAHGPRTVAIGGGTGLSTMLRGLKKYTANLTAIVTVADDGGGSGVLREELGMLPPGDIRNCLQALANTEPTMEALLAYRFREGSLAGQSFGNLFLAALNDMCDGFDEAVRRMSEVLAITGRVLPVTNTDVRLIAEFEDGAVIPGESHIAGYKHRTDSRIRRVRLEPEASALPACLEAIRDAELIVLGPGSLYTSVIPNLLVGGVAEALSRSRAVKVYVLNVMTQDGETEKYTASDHIRALREHGGEGLFDFCLANSTPIPDAALEAYRLEGAEPTVLDVELVESLGITLTRAPIVVCKDRLVRHDPAALAEAILRLYLEHTPTRTFSL
ncbi:MAG: YvcK family protein [Eubacteriales bacterium]|nr:YvcK family protein [Eubacteriales bacterium]